MARWKLGPQGAYYDPNDDGPNQVEPPPQAQPSQPPLTGTDYQMQPMPQQDIPQLPPWMQHTPDAGPGGMTGRMPGPGDIKQMPPWLSGAPMQPETGPPAGMDPTAWQQGQDYLNWIKRPGPRPGFGTPEYVQQFNDRFGGGSPVGAQPPTSAPQGMPRTLSSLGGLFSGGNVPSRGGILGSAINKLKGY